jgi:TetR/AcrR family transcriptional regulator, repressor for neighboring sulfatase
VHYYFGSKDALLAAVLDAGATEIAEEVAHGDDPAQLYQPDSAAVRHARIIAHLILASDDPASIQHDFPTQRVLIAILKDRGLTDRAARQRAAQVSALVLGWQLFGDFLATAAGLDDDGEGDATLVDAVARLVG